MVIIRSRRLLRAIVLFLVVAGDTRHALAQPVPWRSVGPQGGLIQAVVIDPAVPDIIYAGTRGGVLKTTNGGASWTLSNSGLLSLDVRAIAFGSPTSIVYAGTANGVFLSTDGASTWTPTAGGLAGAVTTIVVDRSNGTIYVGMTGGVFKSTNGGAVWQRLSLPSATAIVLDPINQGTLYATSGTGVYKSTDAGATWTQLVIWLFGDTTTALAIDAQNPSTLYFAARLTKFVPRLAYDTKVYKTTDSGASWAEVPITNPGTATAIIVDPRLPNRVFVATTIGLERSENGGATWTLQSNFSRQLTALSLDPVRPDTLVAGSDVFGVFKTFDRGLHWTAINNGVNAGSLESLAVAPGNPSIAYAAIAGWGLFKTTNTGDTWEFALSEFSTMSPGMSAIAIDPTNPDVVYVAARYFNGRTEGGVVFKTVNGGATWNFVYFDLVSSLAIDPFSPSTLYVASNGRVSRTTNGGASWTATGPVTASIDLVKVDPISPSTLYAASSLPLTTNTAQLFKSTDGGASWSPIDQGLGSAVVHALAVDPITPGMMYAGTPDGVFKSVDGGASWIRSSAGLPGTPVLSLALDPLAPNNLYAGTDGDGVFHSEDGGAHWVAWNAGLTARRVTSLLTAPSLRPRVYAGTDGGSVLALEMPPPAFDHDDRADVAVYRAIDRAVVHLAVVGRRAYVDHVRGASAR